MFLKVKSGRLAKHYFALYVKTYCRSKVHFLYTLGGISGNSRSNSHLFGVWIAHFSDKRCSCFVSIMKTEETLLHPHAPKCCKEWLISSPQANDDQNVHLRVEVHLNVHLLLGVEGRPFEGILERRPCCSASSLYLSFAVRVPAVGETTTIQHSVDEIPLLTLNSPSEFHLTKSCQMH
jgi:hypothetical protein